MRAIWQTSKFGGIGTDGLVIVEEMDSTMFLVPDYTVEVDRYANLLISTMRCSDDQPFDGCRRYYSDSGGTSGSNCEINTGKSSCTIRDTTSRSISK